MANCIIKSNRPRNKGQLPKRINFGVDGDMIQVESPYDQNIKIFSTTTQCRGITYPERHKVIIYAGEHEKLEEFYSTCEHEAIHTGIRNPLTDFILDESYNMDVDEEHLIIRYMMWAKEFLTKDFDFFHNEAVRDELD